MKPQATDLEHVLATLALAASNIERQQELLASLGQSWIGPAGSAAVRSISAQLTGFQNQIDGVVNGIRSMLDLLVTSPEPATMDDSAMPTQGPGGAAQGPQPSGPAQTPGPAQPPKAELRAGIEAEPPAPTEAAPPTSTPTTSEPNGGRVPQLAQVGPW